MKKIAILGSTGSIGKNALLIARHLGKEVVQVTALAANSNIDLLEQQAKEYHPEIIAVFDKQKAKILQKRLPGVQIVAGREGLVEVATHANVEMVISAISGTLGLEPTVAAIHAGKTIGLANKEALVSGGSLVMSLAKKQGVSIIPIDSEHSAIFQCIDGEEPSSIQRLIVTSSGGPFRNFTFDQLKEVTVDHALQHPTWRMGPKVTIDSSTLMNKGLEVIEAHWLFGIPIEQIEVVIHPQSIIHSMVEFIDNSMLAQLSEPNMQTPIQYAMTYPKRLKGTLPKFDFKKNSQLQFYPPDISKFSCLRLAYHAIKKGGSLPCYMNAVNEVLVHRFLNKEIGWSEIGNRLEKLMEKHPVNAVFSLEDLLQVDEQARQEAATI